VFDKTAKEFRLAAAADEQGQTKLSHPENTTI
jgi:hypothetical protein